MVDPTPDQFHTLQTNSGWRRVLADFAVWLDPQPGWYALDIGTGPGLLPGYFQQICSLAVGIDIDPHMYAGTRLSKNLVLADGFTLPFPPGSFQLVTASNLLFLLSDPLAGLQEIARVMAPNGTLGLLNPSEHMNIDAVVKLADERGLDTFSRQTLINWAEKAEINHRWSLSDLTILMAQAGFQLIRSALRVGPGLARLACGQLT